MIPEVYIIIGLIAIPAIGLVRIIRARKKHLSDLHFMDDYREMFVKLVKSISFDYSFCDNEKMDMDAVTWLTLNGVRAQRTAGVLGKGGYVAPFGRYKIERYEYIVNTIQKVVDGDVHSMELSTVDGILLRVIGHFEEIDNQFKKELCNPIKWFKHGVRAVLSIPVVLLSWFGIIDENQASSIQGNRVFKVVSGIFSFVGFVSAVVGLITGWNQFISIIAHLLPWATNL